MTEKVRVPLHQAAGRFVQIDPKATRGATVGVDLFNADGTLWAAPAQEVGAVEIKGLMSVIAGNGFVQLVNDVAAPGALMGYGTNMAGVKGWYRPALFESTGLLSGGTLSINGGDNTKFDIAAAIVGSTDYSGSAAQPTRTVLSVGPFTAVTVASLAVVATYVGIQMPGGTVVQQSSPYTATQRRTIVPLGAVISNGVNLIAVNNLPDVMRAGINQIQDFMAAVGPMNLSGNVISANGAGLDMNKSAGTIFKQGSNFTNDPNNPHGLTLAALTGFSFQYRLSTGTAFATGTAVDPNNYEAPLGTLTAVPAANRFTIQRFTVFTSNLIRAQYGQFVYTTMAEAEAHLSTEAFSTEQNIADNGILLCFLIVQDGATDLSDPTQAKFIPASKFGGPVGSGGTSITNTDGLPEGLVNLYFTDERVDDRAAALFQPSSGGFITWIYNDAAGTMTPVIGALPVGNMAILGHIEGLTMLWVSGTSLTVSTGSAYIEGSGAILNSASAIAKTSLSLSASTWYHVYFYSNAGTPDCELSTTTPVAYSGTARSKTGDTSRRYVGSVKTDGSGNLIQFQHNQPFISYGGSDNSLRNVLANGLATAATTVALSSMVPVTATHASLLLSNISSTRAAATGVPGTANPLGFGAGNSYAGYAGIGNDTSFSAHPMDSSQQVNYMLSGASAAGLYIEVLGYLYGR